MIQYEIFILNCDFSPFLCVDKENTWDVHSVTFRFSVVTFFSFLVVCYVASCLCWLVGFHGCSFGLVLFLLDCITDNDSGNIFLFFTKSPLPLHHLFSLYFSVCLFTVKSYTSLTDFSVLKNITCLLVRQSEHLLPLWLFTFHLQFWLDFAPVNATAWKTFPTSFIVICLFRFFFSGILFCWIIFCP